MKKRILLGSALFILEFVFNLFLAYLFHFDSSIICLFTPIYFFLLFYHRHYHFISKLIWQEIVDLLHIHVLYLFIAFVLSVYIDIRLFIPLLTIAILMFLFDIIVSRTMRKYLKRFATNVLIFGAGKEAVKINQLINYNHYLFIHAVGYVDLEYFTKNKPTDDPDILNKLIPLHVINNVIKKEKVEEIYIVEEGLDSYQLETLTNGLIEHVAVVKYHPALSILQPYNTKVEDLDGNLFVSISDPKYHYLDRLIKKALDLFSGIIGCIVLIPLSLFVKILFIFCHDYDSIWFKQERIGKNGELFTLYKYRSMVKGAEAKLMEAMNNDPKIREEYEKNKKLNNDPRITKAGKLIRKTSLDEFPQFINIIKGEMSLIGPRPYLPGEKKDMGISYRTIIKSKPGITGMWQANGRNNIEFHERCKLDEFYYENWSLNLDIIIIVKTIKAVLFRYGAK